MSQSARAIVRACAQPLQIDIRGGREQKHINQQNTVPLQLEGLSRGVGGPARRCPAVGRLAACPKRSSSFCGWGGGRGRSWGGVQGLLGEGGCAGLQAQFYTSGQVMQSYCTTLFNECTDVQMKEGMNE